jgi:1-deoxy-D-xylulose-5-phosphate reductoisomerase
MIKTITILGSTGSIGANTLDVLDRHPGIFQVFALSAATRHMELAAQCLRYKPRFAVMTDPEHARLLAVQLKQRGSATEVLAGKEALNWIAEHADVDIVMAAIVGSAGLHSSLAAARAGKRLLLANKESLVVGGALFMDAVKAGGATLLPIDSEHSAIFQALPPERSQWSTQIDKIILTASGGPFRKAEPDTLRGISPAQACAHPNWVMGKKISVDSATMMNKALEVIEARYLFELHPDQIEVVIHPQSVIHSMVQFVDKSVMAQMGTPDMRVPIAYGLSWPKRIQSGATALDFRTLQDLSFESIEEHGHPQRFPSLRLAWDCLKGPANSCVVLNAANEIAVEAFLAERIRFDQIHHAIQGALEAVPARACNSVDDLLDLDAAVRRYVSESISVYC